MARHTSLGRFLNTLSTASSSPTQTMFLFSATPRTTVVAAVCSLAAVLCAAGAVVAQQPAAAGAATELSLSFDADASTITFELDAVLHKVHGTAKLSNGAIRWDAEKRACNGTIVIDATSLETGNTKRDRDMHTKVLESATYGTISFECQSFTGPVDASGHPAGDFTALGAFSIHGSSHDVSVPMQFDTTDGVTTIRGTLSVPYVEWGMKDPSKAFLRVGKSVEITLNLVAAKP